MAMSSVETPFFTARKNSYRGKCESCGAVVAEGAGFVYKEAGRWKTCCSSAACGRKLGLAADGAAVAPPRQLTADGRVVMPYDPAAIGLLRAMPGARWNADGKFWSVSLKLSDRERVLELAAKLSLDVAAELRVEAQVDPAVTAAVDRAQSAKLYAYQVKGVEWLAKREAALLADDMGCGKTAQILVALPTNVRAIIVVPGAVKYTWRDEAARWRPDLSVRVLAGRQADSSALIPTHDGELVVINFDILPDDLKLPPKPKGEKTKTHWHGTGATKRAYKAPRKPPIAVELAEQLRGVTLIVDEAHRCKNPKAARSEKVRELRKLCGARRQFLTGTPLENRPLDLYGLLQVMGCERDVFGGWNGFTRDFNAYQEVVDRKGTTVWMWGSPRPEVPEKLRRVMLRRTKAEVLPDLPPKRHVTVTVECSDAALNEEMDALWDDYEDFLSVGSLKLPDFERFSILRAKLAASRIPALLGMVEDYEEQGVPLVVFSAHRKPIDELGQREGWLVITGDTANKQAVAAEFQTGKYKGIAVTIQAGGVGLTLTHASNAIFVDRDWNPASNNQAADRLHRIGQKADAVLYKHLTCDHILERHVDQLLLRKMELIDGAVEKLLSAAPPRATASFRAESDEELAARLAEREKAAQRAEQEHARERVEAIAERENGKAVGRAREQIELTPELKQSVRNALSFMLARCDGAVEKDYSGFNKPDAAIMHMVGATGLDDEDECTFRVAHSILSRYHRQLSASFPELF